MSIPVAILIFDNNGLISYRAYSPKMWPENIDVFMTNLTNYVGYDVTMPNNNVTPYGLLKEIHTRLIDIPVEQRGLTCYFSTYTNNKTYYKPVHHESPIFFYTEPAQKYANQHPNLEHYICIHELI